MKREKQTANEAARTAAKALLRLAAKAARRAYCPYSKYRVGAALRAKDGRVFTGCNVENASYGLTMCAERVALFAAVAAGCREFESLAVAGAGQKPAYPCGACRQALAEFCGPDLPVYIGPAARPVEFETLRLGELLPKRFEL